MAPAAANLKTCIRRTLPLLPIILGTRNKRLFIEKTENILPCRYG